MMGLELGLIGGAFLAGLAMFLAPCTLPLVPAYLAFISGQTEQEVYAQSNRLFHPAVVINGVCFVSGFTLVFVGFGMLAGFFGELAGNVRSVLVPLGGLVIIFFGLSMLNVLHIPFVAIDRRLRVPAYMQPGHPFSSFLIGSIFALGWSPCIGPMLATILFLATFEATFVTGGVLLFVFSIGLALPFIVTAFFYTQVTSLLSQAAWIGRYTVTIGGLVLLVVGGLLLTDSYGVLVAIGSRVFHVLGLGWLFALL